MRPGTRILCHRRGEGEGLHFHFLFVDQVIFPNGVNLRRLRIVKPIYLFFHLQMELKGLDAPVFKEASLIRRRYQGKFHNPNWRGGGGGGGRVVLTSLKRLQNRRLEAS